MINENLAENYKLQGVYIELTSKCNLRCLHCYNESGSLRGMLGIAEFINILDSLQEGEDTAVTLSGGEPLLHPSIWTFIDELDKKNFGKKLMITNATLITPQIAKQLKNHQISIQISLNGSCAETHDKLCGKGNFERTVRGITNLLQEGMQERILIRCMVSAFNLNDIEKMIDILV